MDRLRLRPLDTALTERLLATAVADASPDDVMPPVDDDRPGWTPARQEAFRAFHRDRFPGLNGPHGTVMYAIETGDELVGMIRLTVNEGAGGREAETGIWLGRSVRGRGLGKAALRALVAEAAAAGITTIVADTTPGNAAALGLLRDAGATLTPDPDAAKVYARIRVSPGERRPGEQ